ncbi:galactose-binding lectin l-1-like [Anguilla rostrata]|uniref:galactose-binding lectin l-1-like n=1 Tax=Anguilla anguilla TaxID=7936 RepID=UPI0015A7DB91|nr:galactose-binding lectin l-1-like [Anguilla anguilla]
MGLPMQLRNLTFRSGMELCVKGVIQSSVIRFAINVGHSSDLIALHFNPRFNYAGDVRTIVLNTKKDETWQEEQRSKEFPFEAGKDFEVTIVFNSDTFDIYLSNGSMVQFPNRLGSMAYKYISFGGEARVRDISVRPSDKPTKR